MRSFRSLFLGVVALVMFAACVPARAQFVMGNFKTVPTADGNSVTQGTSRTTGVTLNKATGKITTHTASLAAGASATFTVTNSTVAIGDVVHVAIRSGQTNKETRVAVTAIAAGSFDVTVQNHHASTAETGAIVINYTVNKAALN